MFLQIRIKCVILYPLSPVQAMEILLLILLQQTKIIWNTWMMNLFIIRAVLSCSPVFHEVLVLQDAVYFFLLISQPKYMLWVLKRTVSVRRFF